MVSCRDARGRPEVYYGDTACSFFSFALPRTVLLPRLQILLTRGEMNKAAGDERRRVGARTTR